ncbi:hypothetical protein CRUP_028198, partial [Coryphaenoides rupestris]
MVVNEREARSRAMYWELRRRTPPSVPVYQQAPLQDDVWELLDGDKDDFLVYDRCGLLTFHIVLPYSFLHYPYIEAAIRATYLKDICNCTTSSSGGNGAAGNGTSRHTMSMNSVSNHTVDGETTLPTMPQGSPKEEAQRENDGQHQHATKPIPGHHIHHH